jgi:hypothetical protein
VSIIGSSQNGWRRFPIIVKSCPWFEEACAVDISKYICFLTGDITQKPSLLTAMLAVNYRGGELGTLLLFLDPMTIIYPQVGVPKWWLYTNSLPNAHHPMHVHEGAFLLHHPTFRFYSNSTVSGLPSRRWENGQKDITRMAYYQYSNNASTTRRSFSIKASFMYHCHILVHKDNDMMRLFCVTHERGALPNAYKIHGFDHYCTVDVDSHQSTSSAYCRLYCTMLTAVALCSRNGFAIEKLPHNNNTRYG